MPTVGDANFPADTWRALLSGSSPWATSARTTAWIRLLAGLCILGLTLSAARLIVAPTPPGSRRWAPLLGAAGCVGLAIAPVIRASGRALVRSVLLAALWRGTVAVCVALAAVATLDGWQIVTFAMFGIALGADIAMTCTFLGWNPQPWLWLLRFLSSGFHLGVLGAVIGLHIARPASAAVARPLYVAMLLIVGVAVATATVITALRRQVETEHHLDIQRHLAEERRLRAHWLHDDVCAGLRLVSLKVQTEDPDSPAVVALLDEFDHHLRLRQLDELFEAGSLRIAEVLQPFIRHAQNMGLTVTSAPSFEEASTRLATDDARTLARVASVVTSNAINAGATSLEYAVRIEDGVVHLEVGDDGPGFRFEEIPFGRGLWSLQRDLEPAGGLEVRTSARLGALVHARLVPGTKVGADVGG